MRRAEPGQEVTASRDAHGITADCTSWTPPVIRSLMLLKQMRTSVLAQKTGIPRESLKKWFAGEDAITARAETVVRMVLGIEQDALTYSRVHVFAVGSRAEDRHALNTVGMMLCQPRLWRLQGDHSPAQPTGSTLYALTTADQHRILIGAYNRAWGGFSIDWIPGATWGCGVKNASTLTTNSDLVSLVDNIIPREDVASELLNDAFLGLSKPHPDGASNLTLRQRLALAEALTY